MMTRNNNFRLEIPQIDAFFRRKSIKRDRKTRELGEHYKRLELYLTNIKLLSVFQEFMVCHSQRR